MMHRILLVDDDQSMLDILKRHLMSRGYEVDVCLSGEAALETLKTEDVGLVITDLKMGGLNGIELCDRISCNHPDLPVLILTGFGTLDTAIEAIRAGAYDFAVKPVSFDALTATVGSALQNYSAKRQLRRLEAKATTKSSIAEEHIVGESRPIIELRSLVGKVANLDTSVLLSGESGTGKELTAKTIHRESKRHKMPFVVINCATIAESSIEKDLFGQIDDPKAKVIPEECGLVGSSEGGTLFFDEIVHLPLHLQPKLLRLLEERLYRPLGSRHEIPCSARFIVATNEDLDKAVKRGGFREDLFFRINVMHIKLIPLRERGSDILILAHHFLKYFTSRFDKNIKSFADRVIEKLVGYHWPGNVRELRNTIERAVVVAKYDHLVVEDLPENIQRFKVTELFSEQGQDKLIPIDVVEERHILGVLKEVGGNKVLAAKVLKMDRKTLYRKLDQYGYRDE